MAAWRWGSAALLAVAAAGCEPTVEDTIGHLGDADAREVARQELLLAKDRAVAPLLAALADPQQRAARPEVVEVLASLMTRVEAPAIAAALIDHLQTDPDPEVRARIANRMGLFRHDGAAAALVRALQDTVAQVRYQSLLALGRLGDRLDEAQLHAVRERARTLVTDADGRVRQEAMIHLAAGVSQFIARARQATLEGQLAEAESLYAQAAVYAPHSQRANYRLGRHYLESGRTERGLALLRQHGMLLDVPRLPRAPLVDGRLDDAVWQQAAAADSFFQFSQTHDAALPSEVHTRVRIGYTADGLYLGYDCRDLHPDSLVVGRHPGQVWFDDDVELYADPDFDHRTYCQVGINSVGAVGSSCFDGGLQSPVSWNADGAAAVSVGDSSWSVEYRLPLGTARFPAPRPGAIWGFNLVRVYRGSEYAQWVRTYGTDAHQPDDFGLLLFR